jgi:hypothetical protein
VINSSSRGQDRRPGFCPSREQIRSHSYQHCLNLLGIIYEPDRTTQIMFVVVGVNQIRHGAGDHLLMLLGEVEPPIENRVHASMQRFGKLVIDEFMTARMSDSLTVPGKRNP